MYVQLFVFSLQSNVGMKRASQVTKNSHSVIVQVTKTCNYAQTRYKLPSALSGRDGFKLTNDFKAAVSHLPTVYSARAYTQFLDNWGTVSLLILKPYE